MKQMSSYEGTKTYELEQRIKWLEQQLMFITEKMNVIKLTDPPKSRRQEKVEELAKVMFDTPVGSDNHKSRLVELAEAALEWVEKQIVQATNRPWLSPESDMRCGYDVAVADVRKNLLGEAS